MTHQAKLREQYKKDLATAQAQDKAAEWLQHMGAPVPKLIHVRNLYGIRYSWDYGDHYSIGEHLTPEDCAVIVEKLPPVPLAYAKGNYHYFVPADIEEQFITERESDSGIGTIKEFFEIVPFWLKLDHFGSSIKYHAKVGDEYALISLNVSGGHRYQGAHIDGHVHHYGQHGPVSHITDRRVVLPRVNIYHGDTWAGEFAKPIVYAQGSRDNWGHALVYAHLSNRGPVTITDFIEALKTEI
jgi:hypothetical protein